MSDIETTVIPQIRNVIYGLYSSFPSTGLLVGDLGWASDRECLYRWSGTEWQSIGISSRHGDYADIGDPADYPESSLYQSDDLDRLDMIVDGAWKQIVFQPSLPLWVPGDVIVMFANTEETITGTTYAKYKEIQIASEGTIRVCFDLKGPSGGDSIKGRIYKNDIAYGTEQSLITSTYSTYSEDLVFSKGDLVQLYLRVTGGTAYARNFRLKSNMVHLHTVNLD